MSGEHRAFGIAKPAPIIEEIPAPHVIAEREAAAKRERARRRRIEERAEAALRAVARRAEINNKETS